MLKRAGRYEVVAELGRGGFGQVYRAYDPKLESPVAIKTLTVDNDPATLTRFHNEAAASRRLRHPNIVTIYDFGEQDGLPYIVMELLEGEDLHHVITQRRVLPLWQKIQMAMQIASGLGHAHSKGVVHRDVKPANVMLLPDGDVKIMDFGIALVSQDTQNRLTPRGAVVGTLRYMAPEQFRGSQQDARSDIFSFGLVFYELLSGVHPFHAAEPAAVMYNILNGEAPSLRERCPDCPPQVEEVMARLLQKDVELRYQTLEDVVYDCEPILVELKRASAHDLFHQAKLACQDGQLDAGQNLLRQVMELDPSYPGARELRERLQTELRRAAVRLRTESLANEARDDLARGNHTNAIEKLEAAVRIDPSDTALMSLLEQTRAELVQSRQLARLLADAERAFESGDFATARRIAQQAHDFAPLDPRPGDLVTQAQNALIVRERQTRLTDGLARARRLIGIRSWEQASQLLRHLQEESPTSTELQELRRKLEIDRLADERRQKLSSELDLARREIQAGNLYRARDRLVALQAEFPDAPEVGQLLSYVVSEIEAREHTEAVDNSVRLARAFVEVNRFAEAVDALHAAAIRYPNDPQLQSELRSVSLARLQAERDSALHRALGSARAMQAQGRFEEALAGLLEFSSQFGSEPEIDEIRRVIEQDRENARRAAQVQEMVRRVNELLLSGDVEQAIAILQSPPMAMEQHPQVAELRRLARAEQDRQIVRTAAVQDALSAADALRKQSDFDQATRILATFTARYGSDPKVKLLEQSIQSGREEALRKAEHITRVTSQAATLLAAGKALEAIDLLESSPVSVKDHPELIRLRNEAETLLRWQRDRETAFQTAVSLAAAQEQAGSFDDAVAILQGFVRQYGPDERVTARCQAIEQNHERARRMAEMQTLAGQVEARLRNGEPQGAISLLRENELLLRDSPELRDLLRLAKATLVDEKRRVAIAAKAALEQEEYGAKVLADIEALIAQHQYQQARSALSDALRIRPSDARLVQMGAQIEAHQRDWDSLRMELRIRDEVSQARKLIPVKPAAALEAIERLSAKYPDRSELAAPLHEARDALRQAEEHRLIAEANRLCEQQRFTEALAKLAMAEYQTPELEIARRSVESRRLQAENDRVAREIQRAREIAVRRPELALRRLQELAREFPGTPEIDRAIRAYLAEDMARQQEGSGQSFAQSRKHVGRKWIWLLASILTASLLIVLVWFRRATPDQKATITTKSEVSATMPKEPAPEIPSASGTTTSASASTPGGPIRSKAVATGAAGVPPGPPDVGGPSRPPRAYVPPNTEPAAGAPAVVLPDQPQLANSQLPLPQTSPDRVLPPVTNPAPPATPPSRQPSQESLDQAAVRSVLIEFSSAYFQKSFAGVTARWPSMRKNTILRDAFRDPRFAVLDYSLAPLGPALIQGNQAQIRVHRETRTRDLSAAKPEVSLSADIIVTLQKTAGQWTIFEMK